MSVRERVTENLGLKGLALLLAVLLWLFVAAEQETEMAAQVPVRVVNLAPGLTIVSKVPERVDVTISGPRLFFSKGYRERLEILLDMGNIGEGPVVFTGLEKGLQLPEGQRVTRVYPAAIELKIARVHRP